MERRLAAILAADMVGYSRLIREDEAGTSAALKAHREQLIEAKVAERILPSNLLAPPTRGHKIRVISAQIEFLGATGDAHHTKPLQLDRCLDQTLNEHEFPLRCVNNTQLLST